MTYSHARAGDRQLDGTYTQQCDSCGRMGHEDAVRTRQLSRDWPKFSPVIGRAAASFTVILCASCEAHLEASGDLRPDPETVRAAEIRRLDLCQWPVYLVDVDHSEPAVATAHNRDGFHRLRTCAAHAASVEQSESYVVVYGPRPADWNDERLYDEWRAANHPDFDPSSETFADYIHRTRGADWREYLQGLYQEAQA